MVAAEGVDWFLLIVFELKVFFIEVAHVLFAVLFGEGIVGIVLEITVCIEMGSSLFLLLSGHHSL